MSYETQGIELTNTVGNLPRDVQQAIGEVDVVTEIWKIGGQFELLISEIGDVCEETKKVITGEVRPERFIEDIRLKLGDENKNKATEIGTEINNKILIPIREAYKKISMGNLVPNPNEAKVPEELQQTQRDFATQNLSGQATEESTFSTSYPPKQANPTAQTDQPTAKTFEEQKLGGQTSHSDRDFIMYEIENPTPAGVSTMSYGKTPATQNVPPPPNLPTKNQPDKEMTILRTMKRDIAQEKNAYQSAPDNAPSMDWRQRSSGQPVQHGTQTNLNGQSLTGRGKFGLGAPPTLKSSVNHSQPSSSSEKEAQIPKPPSQNPTVPAPRPTEIFPPKTDKVDNMVEDKLNQTVSVPSERKSYVVDPYREPLE